MICMTIHKLHLPSSNKPTYSILCLRPLSKLQPLFTRGGVLSHNQPLSPHQFNPLPLEGYCTSYALEALDTSQGHAWRGPIFDVSRTPGPIAEYVYSVVEADAGAHIVHPVYLT